MQAHPLIELYISINDGQQNMLIEQQLSSIDLDNVALQTLQAAGITQQIMFTLLVTDDDGIRDMNKQYRHQDKPTDVLSFPLLEKPLVNAPADQLWAIEQTEGQTKNADTTSAFVTPPGMVTNLGDIVISWPTVVR